MYHCRMNVQIRLEATVMCLILKRTHAEGDGIIIIPNGAFCLRWRLIIDVETLHEKAPFTRSISRDTLSQHLLPTIPCLTMSATIMYLSTLCNSPLASTLNNGSKSLSVQLIVALCLVCVGPISGHNCHLRELDYCAATILIFTQNPSGIATTESQLTKQCGYLHEAEQCFYNFTQKCTTPLQRELISFLTEGHLRRFAQASLRVLHSPIPTAEELP